MLIIVDSMGITKRKVILKSKQGNNTSWEAKAMINKKIIITLLKTLISL